MTLTMMLRALLATLTLVPSGGHADVMSACPTNFSDRGVMFVDFFGTVRGPDGFHSAEVVFANDIHNADGPLPSNETVAAFPTLRLGDELVVFGLKTQPEVLDPLIRFTNAEGRTLSRCAIKVVPFDPAQHDLSQTARGFCDFNQTNGITRMTVGDSVTFDLPDRVFETGSGDPSIADMVPMSRNQIQITANRAGTTTLLWSGEDTNGGTLKGLCPIVVTDPS